MRKGFAQLNHIIDITAGDNVEVKAKYGGMDVSDARRLKALEDENAKLKRLYADAMLDNAGLKDLLSKKVVTPAARRDAVAQVRTLLGVSERLARLLRTYAMSRRGFREGPNMTHLGTGRRARDRL